MSGKNELLNDFILETMENIQQANNSLAFLEKNRDDKEHVNAVYRCMHTLKSSAGLMGFQKTQELAHLVENMLDDIREDVSYLDDNLIEALVIYLDETYEQLKVIERTGEEDVSKIDKLKIKFLAFHEGKDQNLLNSDLKIFAGVSEPIDLKVEEQSADESSPSTSEPRQTLKVLQSLDNSSDENNEEEVVIERKSVADTTIRVNVGLLDKIMNKVGELVLNRNQILQFTNEFNSPVLSKLSQELNVITTELQTDIMVTRMQPVGTVLQKFERVLRDFCRSSGKKIRLKLHGEETELDKSLLEMIKDPLTHIVRNSMDHGVELPGDRIAAGKSEEAKITVRAYHESGQVTIEVQDDGKGLSRDVIGKKAVEKGLVTSEELAKLSDEKVFSYIFYPGFSTAQAVTKVSGRGVGMDVVRTNVEKIGGSIHLSSEEGKSTTIKLKIPLTLAIIPALTVKSCGEIFAIPQTNVYELVRFEGDEKDYVEKVLNSEFIRLRGKLIPIFRINEALGLDKVKEKTRLSRLALDNYLTTSMSTKEETSATYSENEANIIILSAEGTEFGLIVEEILDTEEIVVKPLEKYLADITHFAGATIMGNGDVALIIDALGFYNSVRGTNDEGARVELEDDDNKKGEFRDIHENILFRLSDERVYSAPLSLISRLEEVKKRDIEKVGDSLVIRYNQKPMILIDISQKLKLTKKICSLQDSHLETIKVLVVFNNESYYGLIVEDILDISITEAIVDSDVIDRPGFLGTLYLDGQIVTLINIHQIIEDLHLGERNLPEDERSHSVKRVKNKTLLVVEDSPVYRKMEVDTFKSLGFTVFSAVNGQEGLDKLIEHKNIDIVVTDIEMPIMNGFEFCRKLRLIDEFKELPVIAISTKVTTKDKAIGEEVGFSQHLEKFKREEVISVITSYFV